MKLDADEIVYLSPEGFRRGKPLHKIDITFGPYALLDIVTPEGEAETVKVSLLGSTTLPAGTIIKGHSYHV